MKTGPSAIRTMSLPQRCKIHHHEGTVDTEKTGDSGENQGISESHVRCGRGFVGLSAQNALLRALRASVVPCCMQLGGLLWPVAFSSDPAGAPCSPLPDADRTLYNQLSSRKYRVLHAKPVFPWGCARPASPRGERVAGGGEDPCESDPCLPKCDPCGCPETNVCPDCPCDTGECCDSGNCVVATCNDLNPCTDDVCVDGECQHTNNTATCDDDGNPCTTDVCSGGVCTHPNKTDGSPCPDDGKPCTNDRCQSGNCVHPDKVVGSPCPDDGNPCTQDLCDGTGSCVHPPRCPAGDCCFQGACGASDCTPTRITGGTNCCDGGVCGRYETWATHLCGASNCANDPEGIKVCQTIGVKPTGGTRLNGACSSYFPPEECPDNCYLFVLMPPYFFPADTTCCCIEGD